MDGAGDGLCVELENAFVRDDLHGPRRDDAAAELNCEPGPQDAVRVGGDGVGGLGVDLLARGVERAEVLLAPRERAVGPAHALPGGLDVHVEENRERPGAQPLAIERREHRTAAERDHSVWAGKRLGQDPLLDPPELGLAALEQLADRAVPALDQPVEVDERPRGQLGDTRSHGRLAGSHEAGKRQVTA